MVKRGYNTGTLISADGKGAAIIAKVEPGADRYRVLEQTRSLIASESYGKDSIYLSGSALAQAVLGQATARDLARLIPAVVAVLGVMLFLSFRHLAPALLSHLRRRVTTFTHSAIISTRPKTRHPRRPLWRRSVVRPVPSA